MQRKYRINRMLSVTLAILLVLTLFAGCAKQEAKNGYKAGTYKAQVQGKGGPIEVQVTFSDTKITDIKVLSQAESEGRGDVALETMKKKIIEGQSLAVDTVSGATVSSKAILAAVEDCVKQAGGNVAALKPDNKTTQAKTEKMQTDVVVVGAGASGVCAAVSAADKGAKVILIEKTGIIGGASNLSWAAKFVNSSVALQNKVVLDEEKLIADWIVLNHWRVDAADLRQYITKQKDTYEWLTSKGYPTKFLNYKGEPMHMLPAYNTREGLFKKMLADSVEKNGGMVITKTTGKKILTNAGGEVTGVVAQKDDGTNLEITAKNVIIATGGYAGNKEMVKEQTGFDGVNGGLDQNIGEGLKMAWEVGAKVPDNFGVQMFHQTLTKATTKLKGQYPAFQANFPLMLSYLPTLMNVGLSGARYRDEAAVYIPDAAANTAQFQGNHYYTIISKSQIDALAANGMSGIKAPKLPAMPPEFYLAWKDKFTLDNPWTDADKVLDSMVQNGDGFKGATIDELAKNAGMDAAVLKDTFANYEQACQTGKDTAFGKAKEYLVAYGSGPYYAIPGEINNLASVGGLLVNTKFQVLNAKRIPIKGLYAVGLESEGVLFSDTYVGNGDGLGYAFTSGYLGGEYAANAALGK